MARRLRILGVSLTSIVLASLTGMGAVAAPRSLADTREELRIVALSSRPDVVSGGDALVRVEVPRAVPLGEVTIELNDADVTAAFRPEDAAHTLTGLVTGLRTGENELEARIRSRAHRRSSAELTLNNHPISGPVFSGPQEQPFICQTQDFVLFPGGPKLGPPLDPSCSAATRVDYVYRSTSGAFTALPVLSTRPADLAQTQTLAGRTVPFIVRVETGTINRAIFQTAVLHDPATEPSPDTFTRPAGWNGRLIYVFGGGCPGGWYIQGRNTGGVLDPVMLGRGYATASATLNVFGNNCNDLLAAETMAMVKEHFIKRAGAPRFTIGFGCSGGSYQVHQIGDNYPGLLDGIIAGCSFPEVGFATIHTITDARLLHHYFTRTAPTQFSREQQRAVAGFGKWESIANLTVGAGRIAPREFCSPAIPISLLYDPAANPGGARCTVYDHTVNVYGPDPQTGFARRPLDNVGIQYGLAALNAGTITTEQFLDLNERIGGFDADANLVAQRTAADLEATRAAYETGRLLNGGAGLATMPIIDYRAYTDDLPNGDIHMRFHSFSTRERLIKANRRADNQVMLVEDFRHGFFSTGSVVLREALNEMDRWLSSLQNDTSEDPQITRVVRAKPADLVDACWTREPVQRKIAEGQTFAGPGACNSLFPSFPAARQVAGGPLANDIIKCQLKDPDRSDYTVTFTETERARLARIFADGVCDWSQPGVEQRPLKGTWLSFPME